ncbi:MAG: glycosyltransferase family 2 protein, partial [Planctomycetes bacterium]|nr:glycosyltransferase family 2 protein [Planctomycetota bacterium]
MPAHNEEGILATTVEKILVELEREGIPTELIVVDDNSTDGTRAIAEQLQQRWPAIRIVSRTPPGGFGRAIRSGLEAVTGDVVIVVMADDSDDPRDIVAYYRKIEEGYDCVFGSRFRKGSVVKDYPWFKRVLNRVVNKVIQFLFWTRFNDITNAFKAYRTEVVRQCGPYTACHFNITIEMSLSTLIRRYHIAEIPISWYGRTWGSSSLRVTEMGRRYLSVLLKLLFDKILISDDLLSERAASRARSERESRALQDRLDQ